MRGAIKAIDHDRETGVATLTVLDEFGDVSLVHADGGPLLRAILEGTFRVGDIIEHQMVLIGRMPASPAK